MMPFLLLAGCRDLLAPWDPPRPVPDDTDPVIDTGDSAPPDTGETQETGDSGPEPVVVPTYDREGAAPWGVKFHILEVAGGSGADGALQVGDIPTVTFYVDDDDGLPYYPSELDSLSFGMAGPSGHMAIVYYGPDVDVDVAAIEPVAWLPEQTDTAGDTGGNQGSDDPADGIAWRFTFPAPIPAEYHAAPNDTVVITDYDGDYGGMPVEDGTYLVAAWGHLEYEDGSDTERDGGSDTEWVLLGEGATFEARERVLTSNCAACHGENLTAHGGGRVGGVELCIVCHVAGAEDRYSPSDVTTTAGLTVFMPVMIHKIHRGSGLATPFVVNGYPSGGGRVDADDDGDYDYAENDFSKIVFPSIPGGVANCYLCHGGAAQGEHIQDYLSRNACGACHDDIVWSTGENHSPGPQPDDVGCAVTGCHTESSVMSAHEDIRFDDEANPGLNMEITEVSGGTGPGSNFVPGDLLVVKFTAAYDDGTPLDALDGTLDRGALRLAGPLEHFQQLLELDDLAETSIANTRTGVWTYTAQVAIPAEVPAQPNDTEDIGYEGGDWKGLAPPSGTYRVAISGNLVLTDDEGAEHRVPAAATYDVLFGDATGLDTHEVVDQALCEACHTRLWVHGDRRTGTANCSTCHTVGAEDRYSATDPATTPGLTIDFPVLLHQIHRGSDLSTDLVVNGYGSPYAANDFSAVEFPRFDGGVARCTACHVDDSYAAPSGRICRSCHDSDAAAAHTSLMTDATYGESCAVCHAADKIMAVDVVHGL